MLQPSAPDLHSSSRSVRWGVAATDLEDTRQLRSETSESTKTVALGDAPRARGYLLELIAETDKLMNEVQTVLRRIGVELHRLGLPASALTSSCPPPASAEFALLSPRESEIAELLSEGHRVSSIARVLFISQHTVRNHLRSIYRKIGVTSQAELIEKLKGSARPKPNPAESLRLG